MIDPLAASGPFSWPVDRFVESRLRPLVPTLDQCRLLELCGRLDRLSDLRRDRSYVGLEVDHRSCGPVDCYFSGGEELFALLHAGICPLSPSLFPRWMPQLYHLEFDDAEGGYIFAGYSQRCDFAGVSDSDILLVAQNFVAHHLDSAAVAALSRSGVTALIALLGGPVHLAMMLGRQRHWLKLIFPLACGQLTPLRAQIMDGRLPRQLGHLVDVWPLLETCLSLLPERACKISLDLDLESADFSERIGLEISIPRCDAAHSSRQVQLLERLLQPVHDSLLGYQQVLSLQAAIPYGECHFEGLPADPLLTTDRAIDQLFLVTTSHVKICLMPRSRWVKSYLGLCRLLQPHGARGKSDAPLGGLSPSGLA